MVMEPKLYEAAMEGKIDVLRECMNPEYVQLTANKNTVLHVAVQFDKGSTSGVKEILAKMGSSLLCMVNSDGDTPLHIAAWKGRTDAVKDLIDCAKEEGNELESGVKVITKMLRKTNKDGDTALHMAIRSVSWNRDDVVKMLTEEDPESSNSANNAEETPLYLAAERSYCGIVSEIVKICTLSACGGPEGRTALHAAVSAGCSDCLKNLYEGKPELTKKADINGWTPLHHAAGLGSTSMVQALLDLDKSVAYLRTKDEDGSNTALHIATSQGKEEIMKKILSSNPDCWEMANGRGQNILHIAIEYEQQKIVKFILGKPWHTNLINKKDHNGNTPIHLFAASNNSRLLDLEKLKGILDLMAFNKKNMTPLDLVTRNDQYEKLLERFRRPKNLCSILRPLDFLSLIFLPILILYYIFWVFLEIRWRIQNFYVSEEPTKQKVLIRGLLMMADGRPDRQNRKQNSISKVPAKPKEEIHRDFRKEADTNLIVATLIATVTFTAGFTMPGGYGNDGSDKGMATLARQAAFQIFVISNTLAMILSTCAVFSHFLASGLPDKNKALKYYGIATFLIVVAMIAMVVAFTAGTCGVLAHSLGLVIYIAFLGGLCSLIYCRFLWKTWRVL